ncbi:hypothetical protein KQH56_01405 [bacterium]|nr:hypothetical protein [bacterium]
MMGLLVFFLFSLPILSSLLIGLVKDRFGGSILLGQVVISLTGALALFVYGEGHLSPPISFISEPIYFVVGRTPILIYCCVLFILGVLLLVYARRGKAPYSKFHSSLICLSISFGFIAFISGQFMVRYIALDIIGLLASATVIRNFDDRFGIRHFNFVFIMLRLGDLFLLAAILLIHAYAHTLDISMMIEEVAGLPIGAQGWAYVCFLLAVMVKMGAAPFAGWVKRAREITDPVSYWISGILIPALGYYLLYRILPIREAVPMLQWVTFGLGLVSLGLAYLPSARQTSHESGTWTNQIYSALLISTVAFTTPGQMAWLIISLLFSRIFVTLLSPTSNLTMVFRWGFPFLVNVIFIIINLSSMPAGVLIVWFVMAVLAGYLDWRMTYRNTKVRPDNVFVPLSDRPEGDHADFVAAIWKMARWINQHVEKGILNAGFEKLKSGVIGFSTWLSKNIEDRFEPVMARLGDCLLQTSEVEKGYDRAINWIGDQFMVLARGALAEMETKPAKEVSENLKRSMDSLKDYEVTRKRSFRYDLIWIPVLLIIILFFMFVLARG